jgi:capsular exopolysaccharide synthesis family protein
VQRVIDAITDRISALSADDPTVDTLSDRAEQLEVEKSLQTGDVEVAEPAVPPRSATSPRPVLNGLVGGVLGVLLALVLAVVLRRRDRPVESEEDLESIVGAEIIARVPRRHETAADRQLFREALHFLRTNLQLREDAKRARVIGVVSPTPGNGKSVIAVGLADALATSGADVIAIDCDLRGPDLHRYLHAELSPGVVDVIDGSEQSSGLLQETSHSGVRLVAAGAALSESTSSSVGLTRITRLLKQMRGNADYVVVDTSAVTIGADSTVVAKALDGVIMVVDLNVVDRDVLAAATEQLRGAGVRIFGIVLNRAGVVQARRGGGFAGWRGRDAQDIREAPPVREASPVREAPPVREASAANGVGRASRGQAGGASSAGVSVPAARRAQGPADRRGP